MDLNENDRCAMAQQGLDSAQTILESLFWGWMLGYYNGEALYFAELAITELEGPGNEPDDFVGAE